MTNQISITTSGNSVSAGVTANQVSVNAANYIPAELFNVNLYGATGDGTTDDTAAIQAAIDAAELVNGEVYLPTPLVNYKLTAALVIDAPITLSGAGVVAHYGAMDDAESRIIGCEIPTQSPYLSGSVLVMHTAATDAIQINVTASSVHLKDFGIKFADVIRFTNTGHGINALPPVNPTDTPQREFGVFDGRWENVMVWGHDGNHYGFRIVNPVLCTFTHLRTYGGGGFEFFSSCPMYSPGNCVVNHSYTALFAGGTAHGIYIHSDATGGKFILNVFERPQVNALDGPAAWNLTPLDSVNQYTWYADTNALKLMLIAPDFETYLVTCPNTISTNNGMDGFNMLGNQSGGTSGTKLSNANINQNGLVLNDDNGAITAELLPDGVVIQSPDTTLWKITVSDAGVISAATLNPPPGWWLAGGLLVDGDWAAVYDATGAASLSASYSNLANPGTNDAGVGVAPTWNATDGWIFNGSTQYLTTVAIEKTWTIVVEYTGYDGTNFIWGSFEASESSASLNVSGAAMQFYHNFGAKTNAPVLTAGNYIVANNKAYRNGVLEAQQTGTVGGTNPTVLAFIGCVNYPAGGGAFGFAGVKIQRFAIANRELTQTEITALVAAMA